MPESPPDNAVFDFENILPQLDFLPIAARRALDHSGLRLAIEAWRSLSLEDRCQLVAAGASDIVDAVAVSAVVRRATPPAQRIEIVGDPDPLAPPDGLARLSEPVPLDPRQWARLRALDRYALSHVHRRSIARNDTSLLQAAYEDIVTGHLRSLRPPPPPGEAGGSVSPMAPMRPHPITVPPPPKLPRGEAGRTPRPPEVIAGPSQEPTLPGTGPQPMLPHLAAEQAARAAEGARSRGSDVLELPELPPLRAPVGTAIDDVTPAPGGMRIPDLMIDGARPQLSSHLNDAGEARMVDVGDKPVTARTAVASAVVRMRRETFRRLSQHDTPKGDVLAAARIAGIQAAKRTSELIPLCHIVGLTRVDVTIDLDGASFCARVTATAEARDRTGVEMEALVAASVAGLTIYDMLKGIDRDMVMSDVKLLEKHGGKSGSYQRREA